MEGSESVTAQGLKVLLTRIAYLSSSPYMVIAVVTVLTLSLFLFRVVHTNLDPREPPPIKPKPLIVGHLLGVIKHHAMYFKILS